MMDSPALQPLQPVWLWSLQPLQRHLEFRQVFSQLQCSLDKARAQGIFLYPVSIMVMHCNTRVALQRLQPSKQGFSMRSGTGAAEGTKDA